MKDLFLNFRLFGTKHSLNIQPYVGVQRSTFRADADWEMGIFGVVEPDLFMVPALQVLV